MVGISLLTLVPGVVGGSERYARELCRALARVGELEYRVYVPTIAKDAADGLPSKVVTSYRAARSMPGRVVAMSMAATAPWSVRRQLELGQLEAIDAPFARVQAGVEHASRFTWDECARRHDDVYRSLIAAR